MNIILFGAPGVGKGTQAEILAERLGVRHISTGALFREAISNQTPLGVEAKRYMDQGHLVPDEVTTAMALEAIESSGADGFILDGFPRNRGQAEALYNALRADGKAIDRVVYITAPINELIDRMLKRGRNDDNEEVIRTRFEIYERDTAPVLDFLREIDHVVEVNGVGEIEEVQERILSVLEESTKDEV